MVRRGAKQGAVILDPHDPFNNQVSRRPLQPGPLKDLSTQIHLECTLPSFMKLGCHGRYILLPLIFYFERHVTVGYFT